MLLKCVPLSLEKIGSDSYTSSYSGRNAVFIALGDTELYYSPFIYLSTGFLCVNMALLYLFYFGSLRNARLIQSPKEDVDNEQQMTFEKLPTQKLQQPLENKHENSINTSDSILAIIILLVIAAIMAFFCFKEIPRFKNFWRASKDSCVLFFALNLVTFCCLCYVWIPKLLRSGQDREECLKVALGINVFFTIVNTTTFFLCYQFLRLYLAIVFCVVVGIFIFLSVTLTATEPVEEKAELEI